MENYSGLPDKPLEKEKDSDDDDEKDSILSLFSKSDRKNSQRKTEPAEKKPSEEAKPNGVLERFKQKANETLKVESSESEEQAALDDGSLKKEELPVAISGVAEVRAAQIPQPVDIENLTPQETEDMAALVFLEAAIETGDIKAAAQSANAKLDLNPATVEAFEVEVDNAQNEVQPDPMTEEVAEGDRIEEAYEEDSPAETEAQPDKNEEVVFDRSSEVLDSEKDEEEEPDPASTTTSTGGSGSPPPSPPPPTTTGGPGPPVGPPPPGPRPPFTPNIPPVVPAVVLGGNVAPPMPTTPNTPRVEQLDYGNPAVAALLGGIIGYFIGRRRGRIRTEKKLLPIQKKLEHQVEDLHWEVKRKEIAIRKAAREKLNREGPYVVQRVVAAHEATAVVKPEKSVDENRTNKAEIYEPKTFEKPIIERRPAPEARQLHVPDKAQEHIGHVLMNAESATLAAKIEKSAPQPVKSIETINSEASEKLPEHLRERHVETLNRSELLSLSEKIIIDGSSLRQIYETHLIGERGLRRLVAEYLHGGDVKKILRREIVEHEIDFERDPVVRDATVPASMSLSSTGGSVSPSKDTLNKLVEQASTGFGDGNEQANAYYKARAAYEARDKQNELNKRRLIDVGLIVTIAVLISLVTVLFFYHH